MSPIKTEEFSLANSRRDSQRDVLHLAWKKANSAPVNLARVTWEGHEGGMQEVRVVLLNGTQ